ncbi:MAG: hypothetical protein JXQ73_05005 [Phycisphaerae bacterium]|nr:hypothetical protein [Phycisphaerae bacterium]
MPVSLQCGELEPGMRLFEPIVWHDRVMLPGGKELTSGDISTLKRKFPDMNVRVSDPRLDEAVEFDDDKRDREVAETVRQKVAETMADVGKKYSAQDSVKRVNFHAINAAINEIMKYLAENPVSAAMVAQTFNSGTYLSEHTGNVFYLSMLLGYTARDYVSSERQRLSRARDLQASVTMDLTPLGLGVMFMDLAMLPHQLLYKASRPLSGDDWRTIREHPARATSELPESFSAAAKAVVRCHHENMDGSGYPNRVGPEKIHVLARIGRIADAYVTATAMEIFPEARSAIRVLWEMSVGPYRKYYDPELMKRFLRLIQPFPIGAKLELEDGRKAVVVKYNRADPFKPIAVIAYDAKNEPLPDSVARTPVELDPKAGLRIKSYKGEDLSYLYGSGNGASAPRRSEEPGCLFEIAYP